jgi:hypothetical protein
LEAVAKMVWEVLPHPSYNPHLAPSEYHIVGFMKDQLWGQVLREGRPFRKQCVSVFGRNFTEGEFSIYQNAGRNVHKDVVIMWKNKVRSLD